MAVKSQHIGANFALYNGDCVEVMQDLPTGKVDFSIYSPPFGGLYNYSSDERDLSNCADYDEFFKQYAYTIQQLHRLTKPGRLTAVHCTDIPASNSGTDHLIDFPGDVIRLHDAHGWKFAARHTIWKEPLWVRNRTMAKNLAHKTIVDDAADAGVASADYLLIFRRTGENKVPIAHPVGFNEYAGECPIPAELLKFKGWSGDQKLNKLSHWIWRRYASSIWDDINMGRVLPYQDCREPDDEKHVHPLQLDVIDRALALRSNPGETVLTPFMGVGSEVFASVRGGRNGIGVELKNSYFRQAIKNVENAAEYLITNKSHDDLFEGSM